MLITKLVNMGNAVFAALLSPKAIYAYQELNLLENIGLLLAILDYFHLFWRLIVKMGLLSFDNFIGFFFVRV